MELITKNYYNIDEILKLYPSTKLQKHNYDEILPSLTQNSPNLKWNGWGQSYKIAKNTLEYINRLKTKVYILIIENNHYKDFIKFIPKGSPKELLRFIRKKEKNIIWTKKDIQKLDNTQWKFMSCILQERKGEDKEELHPYHKGLKEITEKYKFPDGMYIFSLRDVLLIHKEKIYPWTHVTGDKIPMRGYPNKFLPVFNTTGGHNHWDIPIPTFEDRDYIFKNKPDLSNINLLWDTKLPTAVFRGGASGCGYNELNNPRIKISKINDILQDPSNSEEIRTLLNAGIPEIPITKKYRFYDGKLGYSDYKKIGINGVGKLNKSEQSNFKYIIYIEGNVAAHRLAVDMLLGSVIFYVESEYMLWFEHLLIENIHYIKIKSDLSDLIEKIQWCRENDDICHQISINSRKFAVEILNKKIFDNIFVNYIRN